MKTAAETLDFILIRIELIDGYGTQTEGDRSTRRALADLAEFMTGERP
jgi:hypothetical protein